jgi:hypothetical protein
MFGCDFSITNEFLPKRELSPGETAVVEVYNEPSIPLIIPQELFSWGVNEVQECFRIFVSADELDTTVHNQAALAMDMRQSKERVVRGKPSGVAVTNDDWCVIDIPYTLIAPFPERDLKRLMVFRQKQLYRRILLRNARCQNALLVRCVGLQKWHWQKVCRIHHL